jgi:hypothetical protein
VTGGSVTEYKIRARISAPLFCEKAMKTQVPIRDMHSHLQGYQAEADRDLSNNKRHVYFSRPMNKWIIVRRKGNMAEFEFKNDCPCSYDY